MSVVHVNCIVPKSSFPILFKVVGDLNESVQARCCFMEVSKDSLLFLDDP